MKFSNAKFSATSLADIAEHFEKQAKASHDAARTSKTQRLVRYHEGQAHAFTTAAVTLRSTTLEAK
jgi:2C-methyl-D-erythritol 2,4-cyclodiphosphate synthase